MIGLDTNVLVYAHRSEVPFHERASSRLTELLRGPEAVALCWPVIHEFLGVVTNGRIYRSPTPMPTAVEQVKTWCAAPRLTVVKESMQHLAVLADLCQAGEVSGPMIHDARVAAIYLENGVSEVWSADRDFSRFPQLRVVNPLAA